MRKIMTLLALCVVFYACHKDENPDENPINGGVSNTNLLTQVAINYPDNSNFVQAYTYSKDNQLASITNSDGTLETYSYTDDLITKIDYQFSDPQFHDERYFTYDANKRLTQEVHLYYHNDAGMRTQYTHNNNGTVSFVSYSGNLSSQTEPTLHGTYTLGANGEILQKIQINSETDEQTTFSYAFDNENAAYKNILEGSNGFKLLFSGENNVLAFSLEDDNGNTIYSYTSSFSFNSNDYPSIEFRTSGTGTTEIHYTYK